MFVFRKIWRALFSCNARFEIRPLALLPTICIYIKNVSGSFKKFAISNYGILQLLPFCCTFSHFGKIPFSDISFTETKNYSGRELQIKSIRSSKGISIYLNMTNNASEK